MRRSRTCSTIAAARPIPVGRLMLRLYAAESPANRSASDAICTALQLINFWQDIAVDWQKGRVYLPGEDLARFGVTEAHIAAARCDDAWRALLAFESSRARAHARSRTAAHPRAAVAAAASSCPACLPAAIAFSTASTQPAATSSAGGRSFRAPTGRWSRATPVPSAPAPRRASRKRRMTPDEYCQQTTAQERHELLLQLPVPAAGAAARDHRALRVLPRGRRRRRRGHRSRARPHEARLVAAARSAPSSPARRSIRWRSRCDPSWPRIGCRRSTSRR